MNTRRDYMEGKVSHDEYYGQFVTPRVAALVRSHLGERIKRSTDPHFNDVPLRFWDRLADQLKMYDITVLRKLAEANGTGGVSLGDRVCVLKAAAKQIREGKV